MDVSEVKTLLATHPSEWDAAEINTALSVQNAASQIGITPSGGGEMQFISSQSVTEAQRHLFGAMFLIDQKREGSGLLSAADFADGIGFQDTEKNGVIPSQKLYNILTGSQHPPETRFVFYRTQQGGIDFTAVNVNDAAAERGFSREQIAHMVTEKFSRTHGMDHLNTVFNGKLHDFSNPNEFRAHIEDSVVEVDIKQELSQLDTAPPPSLAAESPASPSPVNQSANPSPVPAAEHPVANSGGASLPGKETGITSAIEAEPHGKHGMSKLGLLGIGATLWGAYTAAEASTGSPFEKAQVFAEHAADAIPSVTYAKKMEAGQYEEARLDAASYESTRLQ